MDLIHNQLHYKDICKDLTAQLKENLAKQDPVLHTVINDNYLHMVKSLMAQDAAQRLQITIEDALVTLESINLKEFLK
jgi:hypothetical protein